MLMYSLFLPMACLKYTVLALLLERILNGINSGLFAKKEGIYNILFISFFTILLMGIAQFITNYIKTSAIENALEKIRMNLVNGIFNSNEDEIEKEHSYYVSLYSNDLTMIENNYFYNLFLILEQVFSLLISITIVFTRSWNLGIAFMLLFLLSFVIPKFFDQSIQKATINVSNSNENGLQAIKDAVSGIVSIKNYKSQKEYTLISNKAFDEIRTSKIHSANLQCISLRLSQNSGILATIFGFIYGSYLVSKGNLSLGSMMAVMQMINGIYEPIINIVSAKNGINSVKPICEKIQSNISDNLSAERNNGNFSSSISVQHLFLNYGDKIVLDDVSLNINKGEKILILGKNGAGKSSFLKLLQGNISEFSGTILLDGKEVNNDNNCIKDFSNLVQQSPYIFKNSLSWNLTMGKNYSHETVESIIKRVGLWELYKSRKEEILGENGTSLSGGEKQKIEIGRALISGKPIMLMDEPYSAIDVQSKPIIERYILQNKQLTVIVIEHNVDPESLTYFDKIYNLGSGKMILNERIQLKS